MVLGNGVSSQKKANSKSPYSSSVFKDLWQVSDGLLFTPQGKAIIFLFVTIVVIIMANMVGQVWLNQWNGAIFDAIERKDIVEIQIQLYEFLKIVANLLMLVVAQTWLQETIKLRGREWLTHHLMDGWLVNGRAYRLDASGEDGANPDQRIQEDARHLSELATNLGIGFMQNSMLLVTFISVLWKLSKDVVFDIGEIHVAIPGYMVWCAVLYASLGSLLTWLVGRRLIGLDATRYTREAELRYRLVRVNERAEAVALSRGEEGERRNLDKAFNEVLQVSRAYIFALARLTWITSGYGWLAIVVPTLVALPGYLQGQLTLGGLMMVIGAFNQVQGGLRWFVDNAAAISDWRATLYRVSVFDQALQHIDALHQELDKIELAENPNGNLKFEHLTVLNTFNKVVIQDASVEINEGERVLIVGDSGSGKSTLFRAIAGLWPWGQGRILLPKRETMAFMPQNPYLPLGTLHVAACYPHPPQTYTPEQTRAAFERVGLNDLLEGLCVEERWDRVLSQGQQQLLAFARLLLQKPKWVFLDEATSALDRESQTRVMSIFDNELKGATVVSIGHRSSLGEFHFRQLQLKLSPTGAQLSPHRRDKPLTSLQDKLTTWMARLITTFFLPKAPPPAIIDDKDKEP